MTIRDHIIAFLQAHPAGVDDDQLAAALGLKQRQQANSRCRQLASEGLVHRQMINGKIHNIWAVHPSVGLPPPPPIIQVAPSLLADGARHWFWEGNVQATVARYLVSQSCIIHALADTATKARGKDIVAERNEQPLWLTVKGYPVGTAKTRPSTQAGHWFKQAIFDIIAYRGENASAELGLVLPDFPRYRSLARKITWFPPIANFAYYWVQEAGVVIVE